VVIYVVFSDTWNVALVNDEHCLDKWWLYEDCATM